MIWQREHDALLGTMTDKSLSVKLGITYGRVYYRRRKLGVQAYSKYESGIEWGLEMDAILGSDTDSNIAKCLSLSSSAVQIRRLSLGIPAYGQGSNNQPIEWTSQMDSFLGKDIDRTVALELNLCRRTIEGRRHELGIPSYMDQNRIIPDHLVGSDREAKRIYQEKRRQAASGLEDTLTNEQWSSAISFFGGGCAYCGSNCSLEEEHIIPISSGGSRTAANIIPACTSCNSSKRNKELYSWARHKFSEEFADNIVCRIDSYILQTGRSVS